MPAQSPRPHEASLRAGAVAALTAGTLATTAAGSVAAAWAASGWLQPLVSLALFLPAAAMVMRSALAHHPFGRFGAANTVTTARLALVAVVAGFLAAPSTPRAAWTIIAVAAAAAALDGLDGWWARRQRMASPFGARFDMETDALLILLLSILVWRFDKAGAWVLLCGLMRYAFVAAGRLLPWLAGPLRSTRRGKTVAVLQVVGLCTALGPVVVLPVSALVAAATLAMLAWSFALDVAWLRHRALPAGALAR